MWYHGKWQRRDTHTLSGRFYCGNLPSLSCLQHHSLECIYILDKHCSGGTPHFTTMSRCSCSCTNNSGNPPKTEPPHSLLHSILFTWSVRFFSSVSPWPSSTLLFDVGWISKKMNQIIDFDTHVNIVPLHWLRVLLCDLERSKNIPFIERVAILSDHCISLRETLILPSLGEHSWMG